VHKKPLQKSIEARLPRALSVRLHALRNVKGRKLKIQNIMRALASSGRTSLDDQARALGLHRSTVWTLKRDKHKLARLSAKTIERIIANPETPPLVLAAVQEYVREKLGAVEDYGDKQREQTGNRTKNKN
jgi:hypothetical protein